MMMELDKEGDSTKNIGDMPALSLHFHAAAIDILGILVGDLALGACDSPKSALREQLQKSL